jgi:flagellar hook-basal body complex protein FliE
MSNIASMIDITSGAIGNVMKNTQSTAAAKTSDSSTFDGIYNAAINLVSNTNNYLQDAQAAEVAFATGKLTSTHELAVIEQKANLSLQYTVAIKNQLLTAYREIMNIQV